MTPHARRLLLFLAVFLLGALPLIVILSCLFHYLILGVWLEFRPSTVPILLFNALGGGFFAAYLWWELRPKTKPQREFEDRALTWLAVKEQADVRVAIELNISSMAPEYAKLFRKALKSL